MSPLPRLRRGDPFAERIGRRETCARCGAELHCCRNCRFYAPECTTTAPRTRRSGWWRRRAATSATTRPRREAGRRRRPRRRADATRQPVQEEALMKIVLALAAAALLASCTRRRSSARGAGFVDEHYVQINLVAAKAFTRAWRRRRSRKRATDRRAGDGGGHQASRPLRAARAPPEGEDRVTSSTRAKRAARTPATSSPASGWSPSAARTAAEGLQLPRVD